MEVKIEFMNEDTNNLRLGYLQEGQQIAVLKNVFYECSEKARQRFISELDDSHLVEELKRRGFTITKKQIKQ